MVCGGMLSACPEYSIMARSPALEAGLRQVRIWVESVRGVAVGLRSKARQCLHVGLHLTSVDSGQSVEAVLHGKLGLWHKFRFRAAESKAREVLDPVLASFLRLHSQHPLAVICTLCAAIFLIHK